MAQQEDTQGISSSPVDSVGTEEKKDQNGLERPTYCKQQGNQLFQNKDFEGAVRWYREGLVAATFTTQTLEKKDEIDNGDGRRIRLLLEEERLALSSNLAMALLRVNRPNEALDECNKVLAAQPSHTKALYRRALAHELLQQHQEAIQDLQQCLERTPAQTMPGKRRNIQSALQRILASQQQQQQQQLQQQPENNNTAMSSSSSSSTTAIPPNGVYASSTTTTNGSTAATEATATTTTTMDAMMMTTTTTEPPQQPQHDRIQQRKDVMRLCLSRQNALENNSNLVVQGEALLLLDWDWWCRWCRYVDFFYQQEDDDNNNNKAPLEEQELSVGNRQQQVLKLLPKGAVLVPFVKENEDETADDDSTSSSSSSSEDDDDDDVTSRRRRQQPTTQRNNNNNNNSMGLVPPPPPPPPPMNNSRLWLSSTKGKRDPVFCRQWYPPDALRPNLVRGYDYELIPREVYSALKYWYGETTEPLCRRVDPDGNIQLYPSCRSSSSSNNGTKPAETPRRQLCATCRAPNAKKRCTQCMQVVYCGRSCQESHWSFHKSDCKRHPLNNNNNVNNNNNNSNSSSQQQQQQQKSREIPLLITPLSNPKVGLNNLGNTCFMNSALQCLSHATPLTRHFLSKRFVKDLNVSNPLGTGGKLAYAYDQVLRELWIRRRKTQNQTRTNYQRGGGNSSSSSTSPTALKRAIAIFAPRFAGFSQHDAQEFLAYLLDGLHEDLNRIKRAPYVEMPEVTGQQHRIAGARAWDAHRRRNDSLVLDTFYGQFKSTCICPQCERVSVSFDAFNHVSLELPQKTLPRNMPVLVFGDGGGIPVRYNVRVRRDGRVDQLRQALARVCGGISPTRLAICDVYESAIYDILQDPKTLASIRTTDVLAAYEVDPFTNTTIHTIATHTLEVNPLEGGGKGGGEEEEPTNANKKQPDPTQPSLFGYPLFFSFEADLSCREVWQRVWDLVKHNAPEGDTKLRIHIADSSSRPRGVFPTTTTTTEDDEGNKDSVLPRYSEEKLKTFLGDDCTERFLYIALEWSVSRQDARRFWSLSNHSSYVDSLRASNSVGVTLDQCFETFVRPERLDENNKWYCNRCKEHVRAMKTMELWRLPNILVVHLKRFEFKNSSRRDKLDTLVNFPLEGLDMSKHCHDGHRNDVLVDDGTEAMYDLFGVTNHYGRLGFGHYTAFCRTWDEDGVNDDWTLFDDSSVRAVDDPQNVVTPAGYVLFYRRRQFN